jgi:hypothetical protein
MKRAAEMAGQGPDMAAGLGNVEEKKSLTNATDWVGIPVRCKIPYTKGNVLETQ